jgi:hypothetical protein
MTVPVRGAVPGDLPALLRLYAQLYPELDVRQGVTTAAAWAATLAMPGRTVLVAEVDGAVTGTADLTVLADVAPAGRPYLLVDNVVALALRPPTARYRGAPAAALTPGESGRDVHGRPSGQDVRQDAHVHTRQT